METSEINIPAITPFVPLRDLVVFPHMLVPLFVGRERSIRALDVASEGDQQVFLVAQKDPQVKEPGAEDLFSVGTIAQVVQMIRMSDGNVKLLVEGVRRAKVSQFLVDLPYHAVLLEPFESESEEKSPEYIAELTALERSLKSAFETYRKLHQKIPQEVVSSISKIDDVERLVDIVAAYAALKVSDRQQILEIPSVKERIRRLLELLQSEIEISEMERRIRARIKKQMEKTQKEYFLNEQIQAIQHELGDKDDHRSEVQELEKQLKAKKSRMPVEAVERVQKEIRKLKLMSAMAAEGGVIRNYIEWCLSLPWKTFTPEQIDLEKARAVLDNDHYGLKEPKERILEYLAVRALKGQKAYKAPILCLVGPPGVGKTSLGRSIATATGRKYVRVSLGGVRDEAEIRGHRRTYIGALPGKIIQSIRKAESGNPVMLLDEVDKMSMDFRGDPSSALLEVLDPEQNKSFADHYLDLDYDLSRILFIATANSLYAIPGPLRDRMEIIEMAGYTEEEKLHIAKQFLIERQLEENGVSSEQVSFSDRALYLIIRRYTREAGVRNLERSIASILRKVAKKVLKGRSNFHESITERRVREYLGVEKFRFGAVEEKDQIGVVRGLAYTEAGGDLLDIEVNRFPGSGKLIVTGKLGEIMQESAQAALSFVRSRVAEFGIDETLFQTSDFHIHVPEGAIPKDGPSAGITMVTALISVLLDVPVSRRVAMTGEITLRGRVLPIGGVKEKLYAAHRGGIERVILPADNMKDLKDLPPSVKRGLEIIPVETMDQVIREALVFPSSLEDLLKTRMKDREAKALENLLRPTRSTKSTADRAPIH